MTRARVHAHTHVHTRAHTHVHTRARTDTHTYTHIYTHPKLAVLLLARHTPHDEGALNRLGSQQRVALARQWRQFPLALDLIGLGRKARLCGAIHCHARCHDGLGVCQCPARRRGGVYGIIQGEHGGRETRQMLHLLLRLLARQRAGPKEVHRPYCAPRLAEHRLRHVGKHVPHRPQRKRPQQVLLEQQLIKRVPARASGEAIAHKAALTRVQVYRKERPWVEGLIGVGHRLDAQRQQLFY